MRALLIPAGGELPRLVDVAYDGTDYRAVAEAIGASWVEHVRTVLPDVALIVDEEGLLDGRWFNALASRLYSHFASRIVGDVLVFSELDTPAGRDITDLSDEHLGLVAVLLGIDPQELHT